jgi:hypothetical protein
VKYQVRIICSAEKEMDKLPALIHGHISRKILLLEDNPRPRGAKKLSGREEYRLSRQIILLRELFISPKDKQALYSSLEKEHPRS